MAELIDARIVQARRDLAASEPVLQLDDALVAHRVIL
jgi:hypothetical protein